MTRGNQRELARQKSLKTHKESKVKLESMSFEKKQAHNAEIMKVKQMQNNANQSGSTNTMKIICN